MRTPPERGPIVRQWLEIADDDLKNAKYLAAHQSWRQICYLCQQAVEKYVKALLTARRIPFERTHNIEILAEHLKDAERIGLLSPAVLDLTDYAVDTRYPGYQATSIDKLDANRALKAAASVRKAIHKAVRISLRG